MINYYLKLNTPLVASGTDFTAGYRASAIANLVAGTPYFNGELKLRGKLIGTNIRNRDEKILAELAKIKIIDVTDLTGLNVDNNFTRFCDNISEYRGITKEELLRTKLNITNINFADVELDLGYICTNDSISESRLKHALKQGASIKHFTLTVSLANKLRSMLSEWYDDANLEPHPALINSKYYDIDYSEVLTPVTVSEFLVGLGFKFEPCSLIIRDVAELYDSYYWRSQKKIIRTKMFTCSNDECYIGELALLLELGCTVDAEITSIESKVLTDNLISLANKYPNFKYTIPNKLKVDITNSLHVKNALLLPNEMLVYNRNKCLNITEINVNSQSSVNDLEPYAILGIKIKKPNKNCFKYQEKLYINYLKRLAQDKMVVIE